MRALPDTQKLELLIEQAVTAGEVELYHYEWHSNGRRGVLRIFIEKPGGVTIRDCEQVSRELGVLLDVTDPIQMPYTLEVSSPGLDRKLYAPRHYQAQLGQPAEVKTVEPDANSCRTWRGILEQADDDGFTLKTGDGESKRFRYRDVESARLRI